MKLNIINCNCKSGNIEDLVTNILDDYDINCDFNSDDCPKYRGEIEKLPTDPYYFKFSDAITNKKYQLHIYSESDTDAVMAFYLNDAYIKINSPKVVTLGILNGLNFYVVEEYIQAIALKDWLEKSASRNNYENVLFLIKQLATNLQILHSYKFVHTDVSPKNILVDNLGKTWLIDFETIQQTGNIPRRYGRTPVSEGEELGKDGIATEKSDIQSLGHIIKAWEKRIELPKWLKNKIDYLGEYCTNNNNNPKMDVVIDELQCLINVCCLEEIFDKSKELYKNKYTRFNSDEDTNKCNEYSKNASANGTIYFAGEYKASNKFQNSYILLGDKEIQREKYVGLNTKKSTKAIYTRKIYLDCIIYVWEYDNERIGFISRQKNAPDNFELYRFNTMGIDKSVFAESLNRLIKYRQNIVTETDLKSYYSQILTELKRANKATQVIAARYKIMKKTLSELSKS